MLIRLLAAAAVLFSAPGVRAQAGGFDRLEAEVRGVADSPSEDFRVAWEGAIADSLYARADSLSVLARASIEETTGLAYDSLAWPSPADALALRFLRGDPAALEGIADGGRWWQGWLEWDGEFALVYGPDRVLERGPTSEVMRSALIRDSSRVPPLLREVGATDEDTAAARLALARLAAEVEWDADGTPRVARREQQRLNARAEAFLERYPESRFARFVRREVRYQTVTTAAFSLYGELGGAGVSGTLGEGTEPPLVINAGAGVRRDWWHAELSFRSVQLPFRESRVIGGREIVEGEFLGASLIGVSAGPRFSVGPVDLLPYGTFGVMAQRVFAPGEDAVTFSTYDPPTRLSWGTGLAMEILLPWEVDAEGSQVALRIGAGRMFPRLSGGFDEAFSGYATTFTFGAGAVHRVRRRVE